MKITADYFTIVSEIIGRNGCIALRTPEMKELGRTIDALGLGTQR